METQNIQIAKISKGNRSIQEDLVAIEAQYHVHIDGNTVFSFTCTPSNVDEMVTGALYSRGYICSAAQISSISITNTQIFVSLNRRCVPEETKSADHIRLDEEIIFQTVKNIYSDPDTLFNRTGCAHSCSLMREGKLICTFEDIGRHNALDKVIGYALRGNIPRKECVIFTSGRISGDYMAKIIHAGFPVAVSRAAVTSEAVRLAKEHCVTLYGFVRGNSGNLYNP